MDQPSINYEAATTALLTYSTEYLVLCSRTKILNMLGNNLLPLDTLRDQIAKSSGAGDNRQEEDDYTGFKWSYQLWSIAAKSVGLSGRTLRKLPFLAIALFADPLGKQALEYSVDRSYLTNRYRYRYLMIVL